MSRFRTLMLAAALILPVGTLTGCTSTSSNTDPNRPLNSACPLGLNNDRPCSY